jgi:hypothetical protein
MEELLAICRADLAASQDTCAKLRIELATARLTLEDVRMNQVCAHASDVVVGVLFYLMMISQASQSSIYWMCMCVICYIARYMVVDLFDEYVWLCVIQS